MTIEPHIYIRANDMDYFEGRIVELVTNYVNYENGSALLEEAEGLLSSLIEQVKKDEDIDSQIPLWEEDFVNERMDLDDRDL